VSRCRPCSSMSCVGTLSSTRVPYLRVWCPRGEGRGAPPGELRPSHQVASDGRGGRAPRWVHFHDLRHTGNHLAAGSGATTRELVHRMGHGSMRAALIYQHATNARDRSIADAERAGRIRSDRGPRVTIVRTRPTRTATTARLVRWSRWRNGTLMARTTTAALPMIGRGAVSAGGDGGAGDGNRTRMASLEGWGSAIELRPHTPRRRSGPSVPVASFSVRRVRWATRRSWRSRRLRRALTGAPGCGAVW
jgi:hypothetical protein